MHGDETADHLTEHARGNRLTTEEGAGAPVGGQGPGGEQPSLVELRTGLLRPGQRSPAQRGPATHAVRRGPEPPFHEPSGHPCAGQPGVGTGPGEQRQAGHEHGLAGPRLPSDHGEARGELQARLLNDPEAGDTHLLEHAGDSRSQRDCLAAQRARRARASRGRPAPARATPYPPRATPVRAAGTCAPAGR